MTHVEQVHYDGLQQIARDLREFVAAIDRRVPRVQGPRERTIAIAAAVLRDEALARIRASEIELAGELMPVPPHSTD
jgi:hypothetical protein